MKVAEYIVARLQALGVDTCFMVTGGGAMHLNDAIGGAPGLTRVYCHHEQSASFAADAYARLARKPALVNVTAGPGGINALNGVFGAYTDSLPMIVVSGQVKRETSRDFNPVAGLRQLGDQEVDIVSMAKPITKYVHLVRDEHEVPDVVDRAFFEAVSGRPGPVWLDVPVDVQGTVMPVALEARVKAPLAALEVKPADAAVAEDVLKQVLAAKRPVILAGTGVSVSGSEKALLELAELIGVPVSTAWAHDIFPNEHALYAGRPGTIGTRDGNFILQNADLVLVLGSRLNIRQTSYNWKSFARSAKRLWVDIDKAELSKPFITADSKIVADLTTFIPALSAAAKKLGVKPAHGAWVEWCQTIRQKYRPKVKDYPVSADRINSYHFFFELFTLVEKDDIVVCGDATATIVPYQVGVLKSGMRLISNSGSASMGFDIPGALGAITARPNARVICLAGDGSGMMNLQELQTLRATGANVKVFILNNDGYLSIKQTQRNFFGREAGASSSSGLSFPNFVNIGRAFGFESFALKGTGWQATLASVMKTKGPSFCDVELDLIQEFEPRLKSKMVNGVITTPELEDMHPFLDEAEVRAVRESAQKIS